MQQTLDVLAERNQLSLLNDVELPLSDVLQIVLEYTFNGLGLILARQWNGLMA